MTAEQIERCMTATGLERCVPMWAFFVVGVGAFVIGWMTGVVASSWRPYR